MGGALVTLGRGPQALQSGGRPLGIEGEAVPAVGVGDGLAECRRRGSTTCSPVHSDSKPAASAAVQTAANVWGWLQALLFMLNNPKSMLIA